MTYLKKTAFLLSVALIFIATACSKKFLDTDLERAVRENEEEILGFLQNNNLSGYTKTASGIHYNVTTKNATGKSVELGEEARVYYRLTLLNGSLIDTLLTGEPFSLGFYNGSAFSGFLESVELLKEGEKGTFLIPASQAFQGQASQQAPAWSVIKADIEVLSFRDEEEQIAVYVSEKGFENVEITQTGLRFIPTTTVSGGTPLENGNQVVLKYKGTLLDDVTFDEGEFAPTLGANAVIPGFEEGIKKMKVGEKATIIFPSKIGYGDNGSGSIPPFSPLLFELEILSKR
jgi:FKBP-type peptidyl-prolyl cis-trans isomerase